MNTKYSMTLLIGLAAITCMLGFWRLIRRAPTTKRKKASGTGLAWTLLFFSGGRMPPPPPQSHIDQEVGARKNRSIGLTKDD